MRVHIRPGGHDRSAFVDLRRRAGRDPEDRDGFFPPYRSA